MSTEIKHIEVHWWIKDSTQRARVKGVDIITSKHLSNDLKGIASADCLSDFDKDDANFCLPDIADSGYDAHSDGRDNNAAFVSFHGAINVTVIEPIDFGVTRIKVVKQPKS